MTKVRGISEVKAMRRTFLPFLAVAGLSLLLSACSGESPTAPKPPTDPGPGGTCTVTVALDATSVTPMAGTAIIVRATVRKGGSAVPDGTSVLFTTDFGYFLETGLSSVSKVTQNGFADVTLGATSSGLAKVKATYDCGSAEKSIQYQPVPTNGPFISSIDPTSGSCSGGDLVTINGGRFGTDAASVQVLFGGLPASVQSVADTKLVVLTPTRTLANPQVPEAVDIVVRFFSGSIPTGSVTATKAFTYYCVDPNRRMTVTAIAPNSGIPEGGQQVVITGTNFLPSPESSTATTRVTFGGASASVVSVSNTTITVLTPRRILANPAVPETVDVAVTVDLGLVSQQTGLLPQAFTYRSGGGAGQCVGAPGLFIATVQPESPTGSGSPDGGEIVVIAGGGFTAGGTSTTPERTSVYFGGNQAVTLDVSANSIRVSTPRRVLTSPDRPETVAVKVIVDAGGPAEACVESTGAYTYYPGGYLEPVITSISPSTGPNDSSTRVTVFGRNFALPMQVFVGGVEAVVVEIRASQIIFLTPQATGPNNFLAGQTVDVAVRNPYTGRDTTSPVQFRYYACPTINTVVPVIAPWNQSTVVTIAGQAFEEPVEVTFESGNLQFRPAVTSVSSSLITVVMPPIDPGLGGAAACSNVTGLLRVRFPSVACAEPTNATNSFTYSVNPMTAVSASPTALNQAGGAAGTNGTTPVTITVVGSNFVDPMTVEIFGGNGAAIQVNNAFVANATQLSFSAPAMLDTYLNTQPCSPTGSIVNGIRYVPTSFGIRLRNARTGCTVDLPNVLIYNPTVANQVCRAPITITGTPSPTAAICTAYNSGPFNISGGVGPYNISVTGLPAGLSFTQLGSTVTISGTPQLSVSGPGTASQNYSVSITASDATTSGSTTYSLVVNDQNAPFLVSALATTLDATAVNPLGVSTTVSASKPGLGALTYTSTVPSPALPAGVAFTFAGGTATLTRSAAGATGSSTVTVTVADTPPCGGGRHEGSVDLTLVY
ncbi:MAG: IPT/TIG domain-containing protein [Holophagales bacterium]|jgi:hypothetical protein|nr:IPT/TIG domain-containing protein [Holophagales bacterium]